MHFAFYLGDSGRIGLNLHFKSDMKSGLRVNILIDLLVGLLASMLHCTSGNAFGCMVCCSSAFTSLPCLVSLPHGCNDLFHMLIPPPSFRRQRWGLVVPHTSSVVLRRPVLMLFDISSVAASGTPAHSHTS